ncbi:MAG: FMN-binding protein [Methylococcaceae bacterium]
MLNTSFPTRQPVRLSLRVWVCCVVLNMFLCGEAGSEVYFSKEEAMELAFGKSGLEIEPKPVFLSETQVDAIQKQAHTKLESSLYTVYVGKSDGVPQTYAFIDAQKVRTQQQTLLIVMDRLGRLSKIEILAFHEPPEYRSPARWLNTLAGRSYSELLPNQGIDAISGATLSCHSSLELARRALAIVQIGLLQDTH